MSWAVHPAVAFDSGLRVGQEIEARTIVNNTALRFRARIIKLDKGRLLR